MRQPESAISKRMSEITKTPSKKTGKTKLMADFQSTRNLIVITNMDSARGTCTNYFNDEGSSREQYQQQQLY